MVEQEFPLMDIPNEAECDSLLLQPQLLLVRYLNCIGLLNLLLSRNNCLQTNFDAHQTIAQLSDLELAALKQRNAELEEENQRLRQQLNEAPSVGRPPKYDAQTRQLVIEFYNESHDHTYIVTAAHFNMSTSTLREILKDARDNGITIRPRRR